MTDAELGVLITSQLTAALSLAGVTNGVVQRDYQPQAAGPNKAPTLVYHVIADRRYGWPARNYAQSSQPGIMSQGYRQQHETTIQVTGYSDETSGATWNAGDLTALAAAWCASDEFRAAVRLKGGGVLRVTDIRRPFIRDERDQNAMAPSFDVTITHARTLKLPVHEIDRFQTGLRRV